LCISYHIISYPYPYPGKSRERESGRIDLSISVQFGGSPDRWMDGWMDGLDGLDGLDGWMGHWEREGGLKA
jgi:hypothetical protein